MIPVFLGSIGFIKDAMKNKEGHMILLSWVLAILSISLYFLFMETWAHPTRTFSFVLDPLIIFGSIFLIKKLKSMKLKVGSCLIIIFVLIATPLTILSSTTLSYGAGSINNRSEISTYDWYNLNTNWSDSQIFLADKRSSWAMRGIYWSRGAQLNIIQEIDLFLPENYNRLKQYLNENYNGCNALLMINHYMKDNGLYYIDGNHIYETKLIEIPITAEIENGWVNSSSKNYLKIYCNQYSDIYLVEY
ncbi:MAG: hypothetical protein GF329_07065 [Candidatus Lokiarchaeota archaeon]|nr:hypothetical protein [Candidatus Lokiarchaeota archaeon]